MTQQEIQRINELARLSKQRALTPEEKSEQQMLRAKYLEGFRRNLNAQLDNTVIEYPDGHREKLHRKK